jgi:hypothetical protein
MRSSTRRLKYEAHVYRDEIGTIIRRIAMGAYCTLESIRRHPARLGEIIEQHPKLFRRRRESTMNTIGCRCGEAHRCVIAQCNKV